MALEFIVTLISQMHLSPAGIKKSCRSFDSEEFGFCAANQFIQRLKSASFLGTISFMYGAASLNESHQKS